MFRTQVSFSFGGYGGILRKYNPEGALVWEYEVNNKTELMHHDFDVLPNGNILILVWEKFSEDRALNLGFSGSGPLQGLTLFLVILLLQGNLKKF